MRWATIPLRPFPLLVSHAIEFFGCRSGRRVRAGGAGDIRPGATRIVSALERAAATPGEDDGAFDGERRTCHADGKGALVGIAATIRCYTEDSRRAHREYRP